jgi:hypothetical protein
MAERPADKPERWYEDRPADELLDDADRVELRDRYYGLLQELRVLLPGVQILVAFLLTVPFDSRFEELDQLGRRLYGAALVSGILAIVAFTTPTVLHRLGDRRARSARLTWSIRVTRLGLLLLGAALLLALALVTRLVFGGGAALVVSAGVALCMAAMWILVPTRLASHGAGQDLEP